MLLFKVCKYIVKNNPIIKVPYFMVKSFFYQLFKRLSKKIISKKIFNGKNILLFPNCAISSMFAYSDIPDKKEINFLRELVADNTVFLDIGANIGSYSLMLMDKVSKIFAFEPHPITANRCRMNFLLNNFNCNNVFEVALNNKNGEVFFSDNIKVSSINKIEENPGGNIRVKSCTLDTFAEKYFNQNNFEYLVKIDVEGFEKFVLKGGGYFFTNYKIKGILFECFLENRKDVFRLLEEFGYKIQLINNNNFIAQKILHFK